MSMSWKAWLNFTSKTQTVFHWANQKPDLALSSNAKSEPDNLIEKTELINKNSELNLFRMNKNYSQSSSNNEVLFKFRNYQI